MATPQWITPEGFLGTLTERVSTSTVVEASGDVSSYRIISGQLPGGLYFSTTGTIYGVPFSVGETVRSQFVVRATNSSGITDRTFALDVVGATAPIWVTPQGYLSLGINEQYYAFNRQLVDYQFNAVYDQLPAGQQLRYYIADQDGTLPPGLALSEEGRLTGTITDTLAIDYQISSSGGYDTEKFDSYPYDHVVLVNGNPAFVRLRYIPKIYQFYITVSDGVAVSRRLFKIKVEDPSSLRIDNSLISADSDLYTADSSYVITSQWVSPTNLGVVRANNNQIIQLKVYDPYPELGSTIFDWDTPTVNIDGSPSVHPPNFHLDPDSGALYARLPYQTAYSLSYKFTVRLTKTAYSSNELSSLDKTFLLTVKGEVENSINFVSDSYVGSISPGTQSELYVLAEHTGDPLTIQYILTEGSLPTGLTLLKDGTICGKVAYDSQTYFDREEYGYGSFKLDGGNTTIDKQYTFSIEASDVYRQSAVEKEFYIIVDETNLTKYSNLFVAPLLKKAQRSSYAGFIENRFTFDRSLIYRIDDPAFGIQYYPKMYIEYGLKRIKLNDFYDAMWRYFYNKRFYFGDVKVIKAADANGVHVYDLVYVEILDEYKNSNGESIEGSVEFSNTTIYPNSVANWQTELEAIKIEGITVTTDEFLRPRFMRTINQSTGSPIGFILALPLCYAKPNSGEIIVKRIAISGFDFKTIDFEIDRLIVEENLSTSGAKYLIFPRRNVTGVNLGEYLSYINKEDGPELVTEDGIPLYVEVRGVLNANN